MHILKTNLEQHTGNFHLKNNELPLQELNIADVSFSFEPGGYFFD